MKRYKDLNTQLKLAKVFKAVISAGLVAPVFVSVSTCEKAKPVVEEAQASATIPTTIEITSSTTAVETTTETTPLFIEDEGVIIPTGESLRYDKEANAFFAQADNLYSLEAGEKAGVFVKEAVEVNGKIEPFIGLVPKVLEVLLKKQMEEKKEFSYAFPIDLESAKGIKIKEVDISAIRHF